MKTVYFLTNRDQVEPMPYPEFGGGVTDSVRVGTATMKDPPDHEDPLDPLASTLSVAGVDEIPEEVAAAIAGDGGDHLLIYIHGFNYTFRQAMVRAGWLSRWFGGGLGPVDGPTICYSFPSTGRLLGPATNELELAGLFTGAYQQDYRNATASGPAVAKALRLLAGVARRFKRVRPQRSVTVMAHSMGNHVLAEGVRALGDGEDLKGAFDRLILIAADEAQSAMDAGGPLRTATEFAERSYIYYNRQDLPLLSSEGIHRTNRLGRSGPTRSRKPGRPFQLPENTVVINCSTASPPSAADNDPDWQRHQYYRLYPWVRDDLCLVMHKQPDDIAHFPQRRLSTETPGLINLYSPSLFAAALQMPAGIPRSATPPSPRALATTAV